MSEIERFGRVVAEQFPTLNVLINNAGVQSPEKLTDGSLDLAIAEQTVNINLLGPIRLSHALLPTLSRQPQATIINVSSGLAFLPLATVPTYCATKAAIHSYTHTLRYQLRATAVEVVELIPPYVQTELGQNHGVDPRAMPLADFIREAVDLIGSDPHLTEIVVERCKPLRLAVESGTFQQTFTKLNEAMAQAKP